MKCNTGVLVFLIVTLVCSARDVYDKFDRFIIACHSTDFACFRKQYQSLRDNVYLGNSLFGVEDYEPYYFRYGESETCIKLSGLEESRLVGIGIDSDSKFYTVILELPLKIQQVGNDTGACPPPSHEFNNIGGQPGPLKRFTGNASMEIAFPYELRKKKGQTYMILGEEGLDVILDIPDLAEFREGTEEERQEFKMSEWAYQVIQHVDAAQEFALPYTAGFHNFTEKIALERYLLLYPEEEYTDIHFSYNESPFFNVSILIPSKKSK